MPQRPVPDVSDVKLRPPFAGHIAALTHLPQAGDAGPRRVTVGGGVGVAADLLPDDWPGAPPGHVLARHVDELRQLVQAAGAQKASHARDAWIVPQLAMQRPFSCSVRLPGQRFPQHLVRVHHYGAELEAAERTLLCSDPLMREQRRAGGAERASVRSGAAKASGDESSGRISSVISRATCFPSRNAGNVSDIERRGGSQRRHEFTVTK